MIVVIVGHLFCKAAGQRFALLRRVQYTDLAIKTNQMSTMATCCLDARRFTVCSETADRHSRNAQAFLKNLNQRPEI